MTNWILVISVFKMFVDVCKAGECCKAFYDMTFTFNGETWCDGYCCGTSALGSLECCEHSFLQAPSEDRLGFCTNFFTKNIWAPILIAVGGFGVLLTCIICVCYCYCCHFSKSKETAVAPCDMLQTDHPPSHPPDHFEYIPPTGSYPVHLTQTVVYPITESETPS